MLQQQQPLQLQQQIQNQNFPKQMRLNQENINFEDESKKKQQKQNFQQALQQQIEENKRIREMEKQKKLEQDLKDEQKIKQEMIDLKQRAEEEKRQQLQQQQEVVNKNDLELIAKKQKNEQDQVMTKGQRKRMELLEIYSKQPHSLPTGQNEQTQNVQYQNQDNDFNYLEQIQRKDFTNQRDFHLDYNDRKFDSQQANRQIRPDISREYLELQKPQQIQNNTQIQEQILQKKQIKNELEQLRNEIKQQHLGLQEQLLQIKNEANNAVIERNQKEQELLQLKKEMDNQLIKEKLQKEQLQDALKKNQKDRKFEPISFAPNDYLSNKQLNLDQDRDFQNIPKIIQPPQRSQSYRNHQLPPKYNQPKSNYYNQNDLTLELDLRKSLDNETKLIPLDILDQYKKNDKLEELTLSKVADFGIRPNSSRLAQFRIQNVQQEPKFHINQEFRPSTHQNYNRSSNTTIKIADSIDSVGNTNVLYKEINQILKGLYEEDSNLSSRQGSHKRFNIAANHILSSQSNNNCLKSNNAIPISSNQEFPSFDSKFIFQGTQDNIKINNIKDDYNNILLNQTQDFEKINQRNEDRLKNYGELGFREAGLKIIDEDEEILKLDRLLANYKN